MDITVVAHSGGNLVTFVGCCFNVTIDGPDSLAGTSHALPKTALTCIGSAFRAFITEEMVTLQCETFFLKQVGILSANYHPVWLHHRMQRNWVFPWMRNMFPTPMVCIALNGWYNILLLISNIKCILFIHNFQYKISDNWLNFGF